MPSGICFTLFCGSVSATSVHLFKAIFYLQYEATPWCGGMFWNSHRMYSCLLDAGRLRSPLCTVADHSQVKQQTFALFICLGLGWYGSQSKSTCYVAIGSLRLSPDEILKMSMWLWLHLRFTWSMLRPDCELMLSSHWGYRHAFDGRLTETQSHNVRISPGSHSDFNVKPLCTEFGKWAQILIR